jgi:hypothetical protein
MKYLVLIYGDYRSADLAAVRALTTFKDELAVTGELVSSEGLSYPSEGRVVQVRDGVKVITDGPYGEAKEQLAGFFLVDVADDERAQLVAGHVSTIVGDRVELRQTVL